MAPRRATASSHNAWRRSGKEKFLSVEVERELIARWVEHKDRAALDRLVEAHKPLVLKYASRNRNSGLSLADLAQEGYVGLMEAAHRFDLEKEVRFATYAQWWIRAAVQEFVLRNAGSVRTVTSSRQKSLMYALRRMQAAGKQVIALPDDEKDELAKQFGVSADTVDLLAARLGVRDTSLDARVGPDGDLTLGDLIADDRMTPEETAAVNSETDWRRALLQKALAELPERERHIIEARHLNEDRPILLELGQELGVSKERVRQLEKRALDKIERSVRRQRLEAGSIEDNGRDQPPSLPAG